MRRQAKLLANFLGATKELTSEYADLAEITDTELNQIACAVVSRVTREDRLRVFRALKDQGFSHREIADKTGWDHTTVSKELAVEKSPKGVEKSPRQSGTGGRKKSRAEIAAAAAEEGVTDAPTEKYRIVYADPPWSYGNTQPDYHTEQRDHYPVMELPAICAIPVREWAENDAALFLWVTSPILEESFEVVRAWGFEYKASFVWDKIKHNMGHYNSVRHELLLICTRGSCQPDKQQLFDSVQSIERGKHSEKPVEFYDIIETLYTHGRKLEMFARGAARDGWDVYAHLSELTEAAE